MSGKEMPSVERTIRRLETLSVLGVSLVVLNFGLDLWRRLDFVSEKAEALEVLGEVRGSVEEANLLIGQAERWKETLAAGFDTAEEAAVHLEKAAASLIASTEKAEVRAEPAVAALDAVAADLAGESENSEGAASLHSELESMLSLSVEDLLEAYEGIPKDSFSRRYYSEELPLNTGDWKPGSIVDDLSVEFGVVPDQDQRALLEVKVESFRQAALSAHSKYLLGLHATVAERIAKGDYDRLDESAGAFIGPNGEPVLPSEIGKGSKVLALSLRGNHRFIWDQATYPELHRLDLLNKYIPLLMLEDLRGWFEERSPR